MVTAVQWFISIIGACVVTAEISRGWKILAFIIMGLFFILLAVFYRFRGDDGGWWFRDDEGDPSPVDPDPGGIELEERELIRTVDEIRLGVNLSHV